MFHSGSSSELEICVHFGVFFLENVAATISLTAVKFGELMFFFKISVRHFFIPVTRIFLVYFIISWKLPKIILITEVNIPVLKRLRASAGTNMY